MRKITSFSRSYLRRRATYRMEDECRIWKPGKPVIDPVTKKATREAGETKYEGPCRFWEVSAGSQVVIGEEQITMTQSYLSLPWDAPIPESDDVVKLTKSDDPDLVGRTVSIVSMVRGGGLRASRRFLVQVTDSKRDSW